MLEPKGPGEHLLPHCYFIDEDPGPLVGGYVTSARAKQSKDRMGAQALFIPGKVSSYCTSCPLGYRPSDYTMCLLKLHP